MLQQHTLHSLQTGARHLRVTAILQPEHTLDDSATATHITHYRPAQDTSVLLRSYNQNTLWMIVLQQHTLHSLQTGARHLRVTAILQPEHTLDDSATATHITHYRPAQDTSVLLRSCNQNTHWMIVLQQHTLHSLQTGARHLCVTAILQPEHTLDDSATATHITHYRPAQDTSVLLRSCNQNTHWMIVLQQHTLHSLQTGARHLCVTAILQPEHTLDDSATATHITHYRPAQDTSVLLRSCNQNTHWMIVLQQHTLHSLQTGARHLCVTAILQPEHTLDDSATATHITLTTDRRKTPLCYCNPTTRTHTG